jgi:hypothetical protein
MLRCTLTRARRADQIFVGLISVAVALPVDMLLARAFEIANEGDEPASWLDAPGGSVKLLLGKDAHNGWRLADPERPVSDLLLWCVRYSAETLFASALRLVAWAWRRLRGREPEPDEEEDEGSAAASGSGASAEARGAALRKRLYASVGLLGVYIVWVGFVYVILVRLWKPRAH